MADQSPSRNSEGFSADEVGLKSELEFLRSLSDILCPPNGDAPDVRRALEAISTMRMVLSRAPRSETAPKPDLVAACRGLISYWTRNLGNFQWEKADDHVKRINLALPEAPRE